MVLQSIAVHPNETSSLVFVLKSPPPKPAEAGASMSSLTDVHELEVSTNRIRTKTAHSTTTVPLTATTEKRSNGRFSQLGVGRAATVPCRLRQPPAASTPHAEVGVAYSRRDHYPAAWVFSTYFGSRVRPSMSRLAPTRISSRLLHCSCVMSTARLPRLL